MDYSQVKVGQRYTWNHPDAEYRRTVREFVRVTKKLPGVRVGVSANSDHCAPSPRTRPGSERVKVRTESGEELEIEIGELEPVGNE